MNRSIDSRSDLYALGATFYRMLTGGLPFTAADPCRAAEGDPGRRLGDRYQTAARLESDLRRRLIEWEARQQIDDSTEQGKWNPGHGALGLSICGRSSTPMAVGCGQRRMNPAALFFSLLCRRPERAHELSSTGSPGFRAERRHRSRSPSSTGLLR